jgi:ATP-binding cassette, subfamily G (WHITE), member 2, PDR
MYFLYWLARVPKKDNRVKDASSLKSADNTPPSHDDEAKTEQV